MDKVDAVSALGREASAANRISLSVLTAWAWRWSPGVVGIFQERRVRAVEWSGSHDRIGGPGAECGVTMPQQRSMALCVDVTARGETLLASDASHESLPAKRIGASVIASALLTAMSGADERPGALPF